MELPPEEEIGGKKKAKGPKTALMYAVDLLARQEQSSAKLREKLKRKNYDEEEIEAALQRLMELHYLDDAGACQRQFDFLYEESRSSVRQIVAKLLQRGFESSMIKSCIPSDTYEREKEAALRVLSLKYHRPADPRKMMANLYQKGFAVDAARAAVETFAAQMAERQNGAEDDEG
ncbi:MAG: recombination regulator RecX [Selenomonas sp.]|uniref:regulatory protein RecX n=1 Tax=Selenomonas sp. TaxID=2053611 RepID=UPI0025D0E24E|nr:regulatory protein RecX [Selenomonas sp.]MCI6099385.1 recombination regulator RecX [Selenomonas sp.]MCI6232005.1 recombination regulator RecX [Selenomonas sp.]